MKIEKVMDGCFVAEVKRESFLFGCPSEVTKVFMLQKKVMPKTIIMPADGYRGGVVQSNLEFPLLDFLFISKGYFKGEKLRIIAEEEQIPRIRENLVLGLVIPDRKTLLDWKIPFEVIDAQEKITNYLALKKSDGSITPIEDMVEFISFKDQKVKVGDIEIKVSGRNVFTISHGSQSMPIDLNFYGYQKPPIPILISSVENKRSAFGAIALSRCTSGFDPSGYTTGFLLLINSQPLMVDGVPWTKEHQRAVGFHPGEIVAYIMSHIHEDHAGIIESIINGVRVTLITTREIFYCFSKKIANIIGWAEGKVREMIKFIEVMPGVPFKWYGATFNFFRTVHIIFSIGFEVQFKDKKIVYSGDTMWGDQLRDLLDKEVIDKKQFDIVDKIPRQKADLIIMDGGAGPIHPDPVELNELSWEQKQKIFFTHRSSIPEGVIELRTIIPGQQWEFIPARTWSVGDINAIVNSPLLKELHPQWINSILTQGDIVNVLLGEIVLKEGYPGKNFYIILSGAFSVTINEEEVAKLGTGDFFGEISLIHKVPCTATVRTLSGGRMLEIPKDIFLDIVTSTALGEKLRKIHRVRPILLKCGWMKDLPPQVINKITEKVEERFYKTGEKIIIQGEIGTEFFLVRSGRVQILIESDGLQPKFLATLYSGQFFGEMALLGDGKRVATAIAETDVSVLIIKKDDFEDLIKEVPVLLYVFGTLAEERSKEL